MNPPDFKKRYVVYRRIAELLMFSIVLSVMITFLNISGLVVKRNSVVLMISAFVIVFTVFNFINLRNCYFDMCEACFVAIHAAGHLCRAFPAHDFYRFWHVLNC